MTRPPVLTLKQFMLRQHVLKLYRQFLRAARNVPDVNQRSDIEAWVRHDFRANRAIDPVNEDRIKALVYNAEKMLKELRQSTDLAKAR